MGGPPQSQPAQRSASHWMPLAGVGVAASVALLAVLGITTLRETNTASVPALASGEPVPRVAGVGGVPEGQWDRIEPRIEELFSITFADLCSFLELRYVLLAFVDFFPELVQIRMALF